MKKKKKIEKIAKKIRVEKYSYQLEQKITMKSEKKGNK